MMYTNEERRIIELLRLLAPANQALAQIIVAALGLIERPTEVGVQK